MQFGKSGMQEPGHFATDRHYPVSNFSRKVCQYVKRKIPNVSQNSNPKNHGTKLFPINVLEDDSKEKEKL